MKMSDVLRQMADKIDSIENDKQSQDDSSQNEPELDNNPVMVPPLQQKLELLKKASGVPSTYDDSEQPDELDQVKKNAGLTAVIQHEAGEDNDVLG